MLALLLFLAAEPPAQPATPTPTPAVAAARSPVPATGQYGRPRTLADVARERKLATGKGTGNVSVASGSGGSAPKPSAAAESGSTAEPSDEGPQPQLFVESVSTTETVGGRGETGVFGRIRNAGGAAACNVRVAIRISDTHGVYLASSEVSPDQSLIKAGESVSFSASIQLPPGVAGSRREKNLGYGTTGGGGTLEGMWRILGAADGSIASFSTDCAAKPRRPGD